MLEKVVLHARANAVLKNFGSNALGWPNFRVVWASSRRRFLLGEFRPLYRNAQEWILEELRPADNYGTPEEWNSRKTDQGESRLGPFPYYGDYEELYRLGDIEDPSEHQIQFLATVARQSADMTPMQRAQAWQAEEDRKTKELERVISDMVHALKPSQHEIDDFYTNDFRFEKQQQQRPRYVLGPQLA